VLSVPEAGGEAQEVGAFNCQSDVDLVVAQVFLVELINHLIDGFSVHEVKIVFCVAYPAELIVDGELSDAVDEFDEGLIGHDGDGAFHVLVIHLIWAGALNFVAGVAVVDNFVVILVFLHIYSLFLFPHGCFWF
jgi:hypothetical protein